MLNFSKKDGWTICENSFDPEFMGKVETCFAQGNGYLGLRAAAEEKYLGETRDLLVAGIGIAIEKGQQQGGRKLREEGYHLESIAIVETMDPETQIIRFRQTHDLPSGLK